MIQGYLSAVGVELSITQYDWTTYKTKVQTDPYDICFYGWTGDNGDPDNFMNLLADTNWSMNVAHFQDDEYKALISNFPNDGSVTLEVLDHPDMSENGYTLVKVKVISHSTGKESIVTIGVSVA